MIHQKQTHHAVIADPSLFSSSAVFRSAWAQSWKRIQASSQRPTNWWQIDENMAYVFRIWHLSIKHVQIYACIIIFPINKISMLWDVIMLFFPIFRLQEKRWLIAQKCWTLKMVEVLVVYNSKIPQKNTSQSLQVDPFPLQTAEDSVGHIHNIGNKQLLSSHV